MIWIKHTLVALMAMLMASIILTVLGIGVLTVMLQRGPLELPQLRSFVETRLNRQIVDQDLKIGAIAVMSGETGLGNKILLLDVGLFGPAGEPLLTVPEMQTTFSLLDLIQGQVAPEEISIHGTEIALERRKDGTFSLLSGGADLGTESDVLTLIDRLIQEPGLAALSRVELHDTRVTFRDLATTRTWVLENSTLTITRQGDVLSGRAELALNDSVADGDVITTMLLSAEHHLGSDDAAISFQFADSRPAEIANMFSAFDWLRNLDTRASGSVRANLDGSGQLGDLHGVLDLAAGALRESPASQKIKFNGAKVYFDYSQETDALNLSQVALETSSGAITASGYAQLQRGAKGEVVAMAGQFRMTDLLIQRPDLFEKDVTLDEAALDARVSFSPLKIEVGRLVIFDQGATYRLKGASIAGKTHWRNSYDIDVDRIEYARLMQLWPKIAVPKTRRWVEKNVHYGYARNFAGGLRSVGGKFEFAFNFGLENASFDFLRTMPPLKEGRGFGYLTHKDLRLDLSSGHVIAPDNTRVDVAGTSLYIPDIEAKPTPGEITLNAKGGVQAALGLLDVERFQFLKKAGLSPNVADGAAVVSGTIKVPLEKKAKFSEVKMDLTAELLNVRSDLLIKGRLLTARRMKAEITEKGLELSGEAELENVPLNATWTQAFGKAASSTSLVTADVELTDQNLRQLGVILPKGTVQGATNGAIEVKLKKGTAPEFRLTSNLIGAQLRIPELGWSKSKNTKGSLVMNGSFGDSAKIESLTLDAPGLSAVGALDMKPDSGLQRAVFSKVQVGKWLDTAAVLTPTGQGNTTISLKGGTADLRHLNSGKSSGKGGGNTTLNLALDRVRITNDLSLTAFSGKLNTKGGLKGKFVGRVNGGTRVDGQLFPQKLGTAIELTSKDAGGVMASAKLLENARGGTLRVVMVPRAGTGEYNGTIEIKRTRLKDASAMASLLNAISLVGILQQLEGEGIHFSTVEGQFKLRSNGVKLEKISAVGPSMGMTLDGWYDTRSKSVDFEGVTTPLYAVNGMFERLFGPLMGRRKGEGMFSFTYRMRGPAAKPKVTVNPLSILTPGAFREIFRRRVPEPATQ